MLPKEDVLGIGRARGGAGRGDGIAALVPHGVLGAAVGCAVALAGTGFAM